jgi:integrase
LDRIAAYFELSIAAFDNPKVRPIIRQWRNKYADTPRTADMGMQVLSRVCGYAVEQGKLTVNPCEGIKALYSADRAAIIWTDADIARIKQAVSPEVGHAIDLAAMTGLRRGDLLRLSWSHVHEHEIVIPTNKSGRRVDARIPLYADLRAVLARIPKRAMTILTNSKGYAWTGDGLGSIIIKAKAKAGIGELHFHDLRGTAATKFYAAGLPLRVIAEILGWTEGNVDSIIRKYVDRTAATEAVIRLLDKRAE